MSASASTTARATAASSTTPRTAREQNAKAFIFSSAACQADRSVTTLNADVAIGTPATIGARLTLRKNAASCAANTTDAALAPVSARAA